MLTSTLLISVFPSMNTSGAQEKSAIDFICSMFPYSTSLPLIFSTAEELGLSNVFNKKEEVQHLKAVLDFPVNLDNVRKFAAKIRKLEIARLLRKQLDKAQDKILDVTGL